MPVAATGPPGQLTFAANDKTALTALGKNLSRGDAQIELDHDTPIVRPHAATCASFLGA
jgi:hypothetical protein